MRPRLFALLLLLASGASAQEQVVQETQAWFGAFSSGPLMGPLLGWFDLHARFTPDKQQATYLVRPGLGVRVRPDMVLWLGYLWVPTVTDGAITLDEHRVWQQWTWDLALASGVRFQLRTRLEERFAKGDFGLRLRQFGRAQSPRLGGGPLWLTAWDELFIALNDTTFGQRAGFDQNRLFVGVAWALSQQVRVEGGYFNQFVHGAAPPDAMRHMAMFNLFYAW